MNTDNQSYDAIIVGTGPGGAMVANELSRGQRKVLMLEWGENPRITGGFWQEAKAISTPGKNILITNERLPVIRGVSTGGSTMLFYATCFPVPFDMFRAHGIELEETMEEVKKELPIGPLKDEMIGPMAGKIMESALELGYEWEKIDKFMHQDNWRPRKKFGYFGDRHGVKWTARESVEESVSHGATLVNGAKVRKVIVEGTTATGVEYRKDGKTSIVSGEKIIVSAGGLGSPMILRESGIKDAGRDFFFDPLILARGTVDDIRVPKSEVPMSAGIHMADEGYVMTDITEPYGVSLVNSLMSFKIGQIFANRKMLKIMVKIKDDLGGELDVKGNIIKSLTADDKQKLKSGYERAEKILQNAGAEGIHGTPITAAHPGGTVKIGELLDLNLKTKYDNFYVCDCSVIPEAWGLPPTSTILCLGKRLGKHLLTLDS